ncbi:hypothetical protein Tco_0122341 [Tanacetum coccineum]
MTTLADHIIVVGAENRPPMLKKSMYDSWASRIRLFIKEKKHGRMMIDSIDNGPLVYLTVEENGQTRPMKYSKLTEAQQLQDDCDVQATNIILHGFPPDVLYNLFDKFAYVQGKTLLVVPMFQQGEDPIECINKAIAFLSVVASRVTIQQVQGRQNQSYAGTGNRGIATTSKGKFSSGQPRFVKCYNYQGEGHMARQCTHPKMPRNAAWFKEKLMLAEAQEVGQTLDEEQLAFLADLGISEAPVARQTIPQNLAFQTEDLDAYDLDCDDLSSVKAVLMENLLSYHYYTKGSPLLLVMNSLFQRIYFGTHQDVEPLTFRTTKPCMTAATATAPRDPLSFSNSGSQTSFVHTLSTPAKEFVEGDRTTNPQSRPLIAANQGSTFAITPSSNGKHKREYRCVLPASQRHQGGSNRSVRRRSTMNCLGVRDLQPTTNNLAESSSAHAENTHCIRDEVPQCQDLIVKALADCTIDIKENIADVPWNNERPLENRELNAIIGAYHQEELYTHKEEMAFSDSEVHNDKTCSKTCLNNYETLKKQYDDLLAKQLQTKFEAATYKRGLDTVEAQLVTYRKNEVLFSEEVVVLKREASKDLDQLLGSQITDKSKKGFGYSAVPLPHPLIYNRPNKLDLSYSGLEEFQQPEFEVYGLRDNKSSPVVVEKKTVVPTIPKVDVVRPEQQEKPVRYAEMYRSKGHRGNQRNWNNLKSQQLGSDFVMNNKACFVCGSFDHLKKDCGKRIIKPVWKNTRRLNDHYSIRMTHSNPRTNMIPQVVLMRSGIKAVNTAKPKDAHNAVKRNRFNTVKASAYDLEDPSKQGRNNAQIDEDHFGSDGCTDSGEAGVQQRQKIMKKGRGFLGRRFNSRTSSKDIHTD